MLAVMWMVLGKEVKKFSSSCMLRTRSAGVQRLSTWVFWGLTQGLEAGGKAVLNLVEPRGGCFVD